MGSADHGRARHDGLLSLILERVATEEDPEIVSLERWYSGQTDRHGDGTSWTGCDAEYLRELVDPRQQFALLNVEQSAEDDDHDLTWLAQIRLRGTERVSASEMRTVINLLRLVEECQVPGERLPGYLRLRLATLRFETGLPLDTSLL